jgi:hypothetical protein
MYVGRKVSGEESGGAAAGAGRKGLRLREGGSGLGMGFGGVKFCRINRS